MSNNLTGQKVSFTYKYLIQEKNGSFYNGLGSPIDIVDVSSLENYLIPFIPDSSLNPDQFFWENGYLDVSVIGGDGVSKFYVDASLILRDASIDVLFDRPIPDVTLEYVDGSLSIRDSMIDWLYLNRLDASLDYATYEPRISDASYYYTDDLVTQIVTKNDLGTKIIDLTYDSNEDVSMININNYGEWIKEVSFERDASDNVIAVHVK